MQQASHQLGGEVWEGQPCVSRDVGKKGGVHIVPHQTRKTHQKMQNPSETGLCLCSRQIKQPCSSAEKENLDGFAISSPKHSTGLTYDEALRVRELLEELPEILVPLLVRRTQHLQRTEGPVKRGAARRAGTRSGEPGTPRSRSRGGSDALTEREASSSHHSPAMGGFGL